MKYKFVVSGAAAPSFCSDSAPMKAKELGKEIIRQGGILITGATTGIPAFAAKGAKEGKGFVIGVSPASSYAHHVRTYKLPTENHDIIIFTGFGYSGRNLLLTRIGDAVIIVCGGIGTLNEFTIALEDNKPVGVLTGTGGAADEAANILNNIQDPHRHGAGKIVFSDDPKELIERLKKLIEKEIKEPKVTPPWGE